MVRPEQLEYDERGLVPCIVQDAATGEVLTLAWQTREALERTLRSGQATFWSRSRGEIWIKGATSGNTQSVRAAVADCDRDAVLLRVVPRGPACHTGARSCFFEAIEGAPEAPEAPGQTLARLEKVLRDRQSAAPPGSYTAKLYADENLRHKKIGEEATELVMASLRGDREAVAEESADVLYHLLVLLQPHGIGLQEVAEKLRQREGLVRGTAG
ncbi:MAG TPA: bifunctional phosphoribosyl-AMP cyclohydrolase/phosphoribosyl-ATP diphosphatase HisIE [Myxococcales bacterium]|nr:bifunctional phosphoribosyl-AMP cyclohydrolase/phosphoribosyl-ATP diphosphatase HisIE [Myxococcales bacterium]